MVNDSKSDQEPTGQETATNSTGSAGSSGRAGRVAIAVAVIAAALGVLVIGGGAAFWLLRDDAPDRVSIDSAAQGLDGSAGADGTGGESGTSDSNDSTTAGTESGIEGTWVIDNATGDFDWESATGTFAGFRVDEELANIGATTAVGRTGEVSGSLTVKGAAVTKAEFTVDLASIRTNNNMRDSRVRQALETDTFPEAKLTVLKPIELPSDATGGGTISVEVPAELTVRGVTKEVALGVEARFVDGRMVIVGSTPITFSDFGIEVPSSPIVLSVQDHGEMEFQALMNRG